MTIKERARNLHKQGMSVWEIADNLGTSRPYVHRIVTNYWNHGRKGREDKYIDFEKQRCEVCLRPATLLHHKDLNNENDDKSNLQPLCIPCHNHIHKIERDKKVQEYVNAIPEKKRTEIMEYHYSFTDNGGLGWGSGVISEYDLTLQQFELIKGWYDAKYGMPEFSLEEHPRRGWIEVPDDVEFG